MIAPLPPLLLRGDCLVELARIPDGSVDSVVCDPPYGLEFMGKAWDKYTPLDFELWCAKWAAECYRILKPGGHLLAFGGSRTWHRLAAGIEDAGFEIRDSIAWLYGSGFPKSMDVSKAIDKAAGATREKVRKTGAASAYSANAGNDRPWMQEARENGFIEVDGDIPATDAAREWEGWGTALKPAFEPVVVARKPLGEKTVAANVLAHGTGALNIDATRIATTDDLSGNVNAERVMTNEVYGKGLGVSSGRSAELGGRWPANVVLDESQAVALDEQSGTTKSKRVTGRRTGKADATSYGAFAGQDEV
ncbi:DNA methyltransferase, partial [Streptomyces brasiliscabiei]|uniref:DNA methyltransferase n=4 Tax=Bacillati TaxID=1783272 RepID=UPI0038F7C5C6